MDTLTFIELPEVDKTVLIKYTTLYPSFQNSRLPPQVINNTIFVQQGFSRCARQPHAVAVVRQVSEDLIVVLMVVSLRHGVSHKDRTLYYLYKDENGWRLEDNDSPRVLEAIESWQLTRAFTF